MDREQRQMPVILLMDKASSGERGTIRQWFQNSRFSTFEAANVFEALEEISDFTIEACPDVVLVDVDSYENDFPIMRDMAGITDLSIMTLSSMTSSSKKSDSDCFHGSLGQVATHLDKLFPSSVGSVERPASA